jgi:hypothetical protein
MRTAFDEIADPGPTLAWIVLCKQPGSLGSFALFLHLKVHLTSAFSCLTLQHCYGGTYRGN